MHTVKKSVLQAIRTNPGFTLFLASQIISGFGDTFQFIAVTTLIMNITGSGLVTGFTVICTSLSSVFLSLFAGSLGDRFPARNLLTATSILKGILACSFIFCKNMRSAYLLLILSSSVDAFHNPAKNKLITGILEKDAYILGNSILNGGCGIVYIAGPLLAGLLISRRGYGDVFVINGLSFAVSAAIIRFISLPHKSRGISKNRIYNKINVKHMAGGIGYCFKTPETRNIICIASFISFCVTSVNIAFYSFAFDILGVDGKSWGSMLSILYGMNLTAMLVSVVFKNRINKATLLFVYIMLIAVSGVWYAYGNVANLGAVMFLLAVEGTMLSLCGIYLNTRLQAASKKEYTSRVFGASDFLNNMARVSGVLFAYALLRHQSPAFVFIMGSFLMFGFASYKICTFRRILR